MHLQNLNPNLLFLHLSFKVISEVFIEPLTANTSFHLVKLEPRFLELFDVANQLLFTKLVVSLDNCNPVLPPLGLNVNEELLPISMNEFDAPP